MHNLDFLKTSLAKSAHDFCQYVFPNGRYGNGEYSVGSLNGEPGNSLKIRTMGPKAGMWKDFASGEGGSNLLDLLCKVRHYGFCAGCEEVTNWLHATGNHMPCHMQAMLSKPIVAGEPLPFRGLQSGTSDDIKRLSNLMEIGEEGLHLASKDGILKFINHPTNGRCWCVVDKKNRVRQDRRLDGERFILKDGSTAKSRTLGSPSYPIGLPTEKPIICLVEGSSDILAAYGLIYAEGIEEEVSPVAILGAANRIHLDALEDFRGKFALGFPDYDTAGKIGMSVWEKQLKGIVGAFRVFDYAGLLRDDGQPIKDVRDFLRIDVDQWENDATVRSPFGTFIAELMEEGKIYVTD
jgi:hypothetical protein